VASRIRLIAGRTCSLLVLLLLIGCRDSVPTTHVDVAIGDRMYALELAVDDLSRARGLGGRTSVPDDGGMLFVFPEAAERTFWMKDCLTDIDIMFLGPTGRVLSTYTMTTEPPRRSDESEAAYERRLTPYTSQGDAQYAIELRPGAITDLGIQVGDRINLDSNALKALLR